VVLADKNPGLMALYSEVRDDPEYLIDYLGRMAKLYERDPEGLYYEVRSAWNERVQTPGMLLFLKQTAFNGLFRYSKAGRLNSAWGHYAKPKILDADNLRACSKALQGVELVTATVFQQLAAKPVRKGWLYYLDPPYRGTFDGYDADGFDGEDHAALIRLADHLTERGAHVLYSNSKHPEIEEWVSNLWSRAVVHEVQARDMINRDGGGRGKRAEMLVVGTPVSVPVRVRQPVRFLHRPS
jgi:DNA adenine methylase